MARISKEIYKNYLSADWVELLYTNALKTFEMSIVPNLDSSYIWYPTQNNVFRAFKESSYENVKVVILGQDPYFDGTAVGLAFDNAAGVSKVISPSLRNIIKECNSDVGFTDKTAINTTYLTHWAQQGVLLLNTALTVKRKEPLSHVKMWQPFTQKVIEKLNKKEHLVWLLWGASAQSYKDSINPNHTILTASHPSPLGATKTKEPFIGCKHFSRANQALVKHKQDIIHW